MSPPDFDELRNRGKVLGKHSGEDLVGNVLGFARTYVGVPNRRANVFVATSLLNERQVSAIPE